MVVIIKRGTPPAKRPRWPYNGDELTCPTCGTVFCVEGEDPYTVTRDRRPGVPAMLRGLCPVCFADLEIKEPRQRRAVSDCTETHQEAPKGTGSHIIRH